MGASSLKWEMSANPCLITASRVECQNPLRTPGKRASGQAGNFFGGLPALFGGKKQQANNVFSRGMGIADILQAGGSSAASGISQFRGIQALAKSGAFGKDDVAPENTAATQALFSTIREDAAGTLTQQYMRASTGALDRTSSPHVCIAYIARDLNQPTIACGVTSRRAVSMAVVTASVVRAAADLCDPLTLENISSIGE